MESDSQVSFDRDTATKTITSPIGDLILEATNIRRERTGIHARICVYQDGQITYDNFNLDRREDRLRLFKDAYTKMETLGKDAFPSLHRDIDLFCAAIFQDWEGQRFSFATYDGTEPFEGLVYPLRPYVLDGGGTILFAPPGSGKSYITQLQAICVQLGIGQDFWGVVVQRDGLYVNVERDARMMRRRDRMLAEALGVKGPTKLMYLHARGYGLESIARAVTRWSKQHPNGVIWYDSISRAGLGSLVEDTTATRFVDLMNGAATTWFGIGHTNRKEDDHIYGSIHYDAGEDIGIMLKSQQKEADLGISLTIVKANEGRTGPQTTTFYRLSFGADSLEFAKAKASDFPQAIPRQRELSESEQIEEFLKNNTTATPSEMVEGTSVTKKHISRALQALGSKVVLIRKEGTKHFWGLSSPYQE